MYGGLSILKVQTEKGRPKISNDQTWHPPLRMASLVCVCVVCALVFSGEHVEPARDSKTPAKIETCAFRKDRNSPCSPFAMSARCVN